MKKVYTFGTVSVLLGLLLWNLVPVEAQEIRFQTRAKVWDAYFNVGTQGVRDKTDITTYRAFGMAYPGVFVVQHPTEFIDYWGVRYWSGTTQWMSWIYELTGNMPGFDTFIATVVSGDYYVTESKPIRESPDVVAVAYDPSKGPEAKVGYPNYSPLGPPMANWWLGQKPPGQNHVVEIHNYRYFKYMDPDKDMFPESILIANYATKRGITVTKKVYTWSYPDYDDFELMEVEFENTGDSDGDGKRDLNGGAGLQLNDTFFVFSTRFHISNIGHMWYNYSNFYQATIPIKDLDDWFKYTEAPNYDGPASAKGLKMWYAFDADNPLVAGDDLGQPYIKAQAVNERRAPGMRKEGELTAYQYAGTAPIAYTPSNVNDPGTFSYDTKGDGRYVAPRVADQPYAVKWWNYRTRSDFDQPDSGGRSYKDMYNLFTGPAPTIQPQPKEPTGVHGSFAYGPYDLAPGDKVKIVMALVAAAPVEENMWGWAKLGKQSEMRTDKAFNNLVKHLKAAKDAFKWGYDLPDPPPDVKVEVGVTPTGFNRVRWDDVADNAADPDYSGDEAKDVKGYRVYRSDFKADDWQLLADIPVKDPKYYKGGKYEFADEKSVAGFLYFYSVRAYDKGHSNWNGRGIAIPPLEGGNSSPEQWADGVLPATPYVPATAEANQMQRKVIVVPNPYKVDGSHAYPARGLIRFINIPHKSKIQIFTVVGELMAEINHNDPTKGEASWSQVPIDFIEEASTGIYYFVVESQVPESLGQKQRGTFMLIK